MAEGKYVLFDLPGQVELFNMHDALEGGSGCHRRDQNGT